MLFNYSPDDAEFRRRFEVAKVTRVSSARYLLEALEDDVRSTMKLEEDDIACPKRVHVEHIYPKKPAFTPWPEHDEMLSRLGNLTLLGQSLNKAAKNSDFPTKKRHYDKSTIQITKQLVQFPDWSPDRIVVRQKKLADAAIRIWRIEKPSSSGQKTVKR